MTENEAIEELKLIKHTRIFIPSDEVWEMAIKALEEVQKYHEIGMSLEVVEEFKRMDKEQDGELTVMMKSIRELGQYRRLGTVEEAQSMKDKFKDLKEKNEPKKLRENDECIRCGNELWMLRDTGAKHCQYCGQAIDWE